MKLIFMGSSSFCIPILKALLKTNIDIMRVYTQPPKLAGRGKKLFEVPVSSFAKDMGLEVCQPESFILPSEVENHRLMQPEIILVVAYGLLLPKDEFEFVKSHCAPLVANIPISVLIVNIETNCAYALFVNETPIPFSLY